LLAGPPGIDAAPRLLDLVNERAGELARSDVHRVWRLQCWQSTETILSSAAALSQAAVAPGNQLEDIRLNGVTSL